ncbi:hypothetical protein MHBO_002045 [Bonamia ostreae]|uniref:Uncharacterized protein n=1 Tax=Bonamia ostreae TaxID=126728 RepID=A0ABV2AL30_9EUKA
MLQIIYTILLIASPVATYSFPMPSSPAGPARNETCPMQFGPPCNNSGLDFVVTEPVIATRARIGIALSPYAPNATSPILVGLRLYRLGCVGDRPLLTAQTRPVSPSLQCMVFEFRFPRRRFVLQPGRYRWESPQSSLFPVFQGASTDRIEAGGILTARERRIRCPFEIDLFDPMFSFAFEASPIRSVRAGSRSRYSELLQTRMVNVNMTEIARYALDRSMNSISQRIGILREEMTDLTGALIQMCYMLLRRNDVTERAFLRRNK